MTEQKQYDNTNKGSVWPKTSKAWLDFFSWSLNVEWKEYWINLFPWNWWPKSPTFNIMITPKEETKKEDNVDEDADTSEDEEFNL